MRRSKEELGLVGARYATSLERVSESMHSGTDSAKPQRTRYSQYGVAPCAQYVASASTPASPLKIPPGGVPASLLITSGSAHTFTLLQICPDGHASHATPPVPHAST